MRLFLFTIFILFASKIFAANYYFSNADGDDTRTAAQAQHAATPWKTLNKLNSFFPNLTAGDSVLFKRGDVFEGSIYVIASGSSSMPIVFSSYGTGDKPVITGFTSITGWSLTGNNIWEAGYTSNNAAINMVLINDAPQRIGRYPNSTAANSGYLTLESYSDKSSITDNELPSFPDWTGGEVVIRKNRWVLDRNYITQHTGNTINYNSESGYYASNNYGYFIQNHPQTLDVFGEWYYKSTEKMLGIYAESDPVSLHVEASVTDILVTISGQSNIRFDDLNFTGANTCAFQASNAQNITINNCTILFSGSNAINASGTDHFTVTNCVINYTNNIAFNQTYGVNTILKNNVIKNTGIFAGMGKGDSGSYEAIMLSGNNNLVQYNEIDSTGYIPVTFSGNSVSIKNNFITNFALVKDDGGGIYTWNNSANPPVNADRKIIGNIVLNGKGAGEGTDNSTSLQVHGIYIDDNADHIEISGNTVAACGQYGIFIHNAHDVVLENNTAFNNSSQLVMMHDNIAPNAPVRNINSNSNIFFSKYSTQAVAEYKTIRNDLATFGNFDGNYYCRPIDDRMVIFTSYINNNTYYNRWLDVEGWQNISNNDVHAQRTPVQIPAYTVHSLIGSNKFSNGNFDNNIGGLYAYSPAGNCSVAWNNSSILDDGALKIFFSPATASPNKGSVIIGAGDVAAGKNYILKFSMAGTNENKSVEVFLRKSLSPYNDLSARQLAAIKTGRAENEFLFTATATESDASLVFDIEEHANPLYLDNIELYEANVTITNPDDSIRFEYNNTNDTKTILLDGGYVDAKNNTYPGYIALPPYASAVLIKKPSMLVLPAEVLSFSGKRAGSGIDLKWNILSKETQSYIIERSADGIHFTEIAAISAKNFLKKNTGDYTDSKPLNGKNYYRIKQIFHNNKIVYSKIITVLFISSSINIKDEDVTISPNPATGNVQVSVNTLSMPDYIVLQTARGVLLKTIPYSSANNIINVSSLNSGTYVINVIYADKVVSKKFIKY